MRDNQTPVVFFFRARFNGIRFFRGFLTFTTSVTPFPFLPFPGAVVTMPVAALKNRVVSGEGCTGRLSSSEFARTNAIAR